MLIEQEEFLLNNPITELPDLENQHPIYQMLYEVRQFKTDYEMKFVKKDEEEEKRLVTINHIKEFIVSNPLSFCNTRFENNGMIAEVSPMIYLKGLISSIKADLIIEESFGISRSELDRMRKIRDDLMSFKNFYSLARKAKGVILLASKYEGEIVGTLPPEIWHNIFLYLIPE